jgi:GntR family transcriptional regulator
VLQLPEPDRDSPVPVYRQVATAIIDGIRRGDWQPGDRLPAIPDLVQAAGIARLTAAKALRAVAGQGWAELSPGMGYYVPAELPDTATD